MRFGSIGLLLLLSSAVSARTSTGPEREPLAPSRQATMVVDRPDNKLVTIVGATAEARDAGDTAIVTLSVQVTASEGAQAGKVMLALPHDANVVGLTFDQGNQNFVARPTLVSEGRKAFEADQAVGIDPALLEWTRTTGDMDRLALSMFPIPRGTVATAKITIAMPRFHRLTVAAGTKRQHLVGPFAPASADEAVFASTARVVRRGQSLYVAPQLPDRNAEEITTYVRTSRAALSACYTGDVKRDVVVNFTIGPAGDVIDPGVQGGADFSPCVAKVVGQWQFRRGGDSMAVSYPLRFVPK